MGRASRRRHTRRLRAFRGLHAETGKVKHHVDCDHDHNIPGKFAHTLFSFAFAAELAQQTNEVPGHADRDFDGDEPEDESKHIEFLSVNEDGGSFPVYPSRGQGI